MADPGSDLTVDHANPSSRRVKSSPRYPGAFTSTERGSLPSQITGSSPWRTLNLSWIAGCRCSPTTRAPGSSHLRDGAAVRVLPRQLDDHGPLTCDRVLQDLPKLNRTQVGRSNTHRSNLRCLPRSMKMRTVGGPSGTTLRANMGGWAGSDDDRFVSRRPSRRLEIWRRGGRQHRPVAGLRRSSARLGASLARSCPVGDRRAGDPVLVRASAQGSRGAVSYTKLHNRPAGDGERNFAVLGRRVGCAQSRPRTFHSWRQRAERAVSVPGP